ncbi:MAG: hypothetical protein R2811_16650 [Flavobacteriales bacterium]
MENFYSKEPAWIRVVQVGTLIGMAFLGSVQVETHALNEDPMAPSTPWSLTYAALAGMAAASMSKTRSLKQNLMHGIGALLLFGLLAWRVLWAAIT